jgi:hypothetical protein
VSPTVASLRAQGYERKIREARGRLGKFLEPSTIKGRGTVLADLLYRAEHTSAPDGYSAGGAGEKVGGGDIDSDSTSRTALEITEGDICPRCRGQKTVQVDEGRVEPCKRCSGTGRRWADPIAHLIEQLTAELDSVIQSVVRIDRWREVVVRAGEDKRGREGAFTLGGICSIPSCGAVVSGLGSDRLRNTWCNRCFGHWTTFKVREKSTGDPGADRQRFALQWEAELRATRPDPTI